MSLPDPSVPDQSAQRNFSDLDRRLAYVENVATATGLYIPTSYLDTDSAMAANSDLKVATQKATKAADAAILASAHTYADTGDATEATARAAAVTAEATTRAAADTTNATAITTEATTRASADTTEATTRAAADTTNATAITTEASTRATADTTEATARAAGDSTNATAITTEATTRAAADTTNAAAAAAAQTTANAALPSASRLTAVKTSGETVNNSNTLQDDDELFFSAAASSYYNIELFLILNAANTTADWQWSFSYSGTVNFFRAGPISSGASGILGYSTTAQTPSQLPVTAIGGTFTTGSAGTTNYGLLIRAILATTTAGTFQFRWAQNTADASNSSLSAGSNLIANKVG